MFMFSPSPPPQLLPSRNMARQKQFEVKLQVAINGHWISQAEHDVPESLEDGASTSNRWVIGVNARAAPFRFLIRVSKDFRWDAANVLKVILSFDEGRTVEKYPVFLSKIDIDWAKKGTFRTMQQTADGYQYILDSVALPLLAYDLKEQWFVHTFEFYHMPPNNTANDHEEMLALQQRQHRHQYARIRLVLQPVSMAATSLPRLIGIKCNRDRDWTASRKKAIEQGATLETAIKVESHCEQVVQHKERATQHAPVTFVFLYQEDQEEKERLTSSSTDDIDVRSMPSPEQSAFQEGTRNCTSRAAPHTSLQSPINQAQPQLRQIAHPQIEKEQANETTLSCNNSFEGENEGSAAVNGLRSHVEAQSDAIRPQSDIEIFLQDLRGFETAVREQELQRITDADNQVARIDAEIASIEGDRSDAEADMSIIDERIQELEKRKTILEEERETYQKRILEAKKRTDELLQERSELRDQRSSLGGEDVRSALKDVETDAVRSWRLRVQEIQEEYNQSRKRKHDVLSRSPSCRTR